MKTCKNPIEVKFNFRYNILILFIFCVFVQTNAQTIRYVKPTAAGNGSGSSWANASANLQGMIDSTANGDQVWVAAGKYYPTNTADRNISFTMKEGVKIYGSFSGFETTLNARTAFVIATYPSILSGDIDRDNQVDGDNSYHVIQNLNNGLTNAALLDGFVISGGFADGGSKDSEGGGMLNYLSSPRLKNCQFASNFAINGGGLSHRGLENFPNDIFPMLQADDCIFYNNESANGGGGLNCFYGEPVLTNCKFINNRASIGGGISNYKSSSTLGLKFCTFEGNTATEGGAMNNSSSDLLIYNCSFKGNSATSAGGGIKNVSSGQSVYNSVFLGNSSISGGGLINFSSTAEIVNCTFSGNSASFGAGVVVVGGGANNGIPNTTIKNSIIWGNSSGVGTSFGGIIDISYSDIQGGYAGTANIDTDPLFISQPPVGLGTAGDLQLVSLSPAINSGSNILALGPVDLSGNSRIYNGCVVDMGAYEYQGNSTYIPPAGLSTNNSLSFEGSNDFIDISATDLANCTSASLALTDALTIEYWFKGSNIQSAVRFQQGSNFIVSGWNGSGSTSNKHILSNDGGTNGIAVGAAATDGNWHHVAVTWQKGVPNGFKSYLDGSLVEQKDAANVNLPSFSAGLSLGALNGTSEFTNGSLDELRVWNVARNQSDIRAGMCGSILPQQTGLLLYYKFDHGTPDGDNAGSNKITNSANPNVFSGILQNFALTGSFSNWLAPKTAQTIRYVKHGGTGAGTSWTDASGDLQGMIDICDVQQVWVAAGTYIPTTGTDRTKSFNMKAGVKIYGGFPATGNPVFADRNWNLNKTYLSGDLLGNDIISGYGSSLSITNNSENSYSVISNNDNGLTTSNSLIDGFIITGGNANGTITNTRGGGMYNYNSSPKVVNTAFTGNSAGSGGAVLNNFSFPTFQNIVFSRNFANSGGGLLEAFGSKSTITNSTFYGNGTNIGGPGGGLYITDVSSSEVKNSIFWGNHSPIVGSDISVAPGGTITIDYSLLQSQLTQYTTGYTKGDGMLYGVDPLFVDEPNFDLSLQSNSCAINAGYNAYALDWGGLDILRNPRIYNSGIVDMGAYEFQGQKQAYILPSLTTNNALKFDGVNDYVSITTSDFVNCSSSALNFSDALTIEYWFKGTNPQSAVRFQNGQNYVVAGWGSGTFKHILSNDGGVNGVAVGTAATDGNWHHVAMTWQQNTTNGFKSYLDGVLVEQRQSSNTALPSFNSGMFLGAFDRTSEFLNGALDEVRVWNVARTQAEIQANMCGLILPQNGLILNYKFNHGTVNSGNAANNQLLNSAGSNTFLGTLNNFALTSSNSNWVETNTACTVNFPVVSFSGFTRNSFCAGSSFNLTFTTTGSFNAGNVFQAIISDNNGDFSSGQIIGTSSTVGNIPCTIPSNLVFGSTYRIKVVSTFPSIGDNTNLSNLTVHPKDRTLASPTNNNTSGTSVFKATDSITATNLNSGNANVTYQSGKSILLSPGFSVSNSGAVFKAEIQACD